MTRNLVREITVDFEGNAILECIRWATGKEMAATMTCGRDGVCRLQMNEKDDAWVVLGPAAEAAANAALTTHYTFLPRDDSTLVGHLYQKLIVRTYEGQELTIGGRTAELYNIQIMKT
jgi:hypothetical protein